jgi:hypothetical protein
MHNRFGYQQVIHILRSLRTTITNGYSPTEEANLDLYQGNDQKSLSQTGIASPHWETRQRRGPKHFSHPLNPDRLIWNLPRKAHRIHYTVAFTCSQLLSTLQFSPPHSRKTGLEGWGVLGFAGRVTKGVHICVCPCQMSGNGLKRSGNIKFGPPGLWKTAQL